MAGLSVIDVFQRSTLHESGRACLRCNQQVRGNVRDELVFALEPLVFSPLGVDADMDAGMDNGTC